MGIMKRPLPLLAAVLTLVLAGGTSCTTMYDSHGRPVDVVTPEGAALAAVAAGVVGYAMADGDRDRSYRRRSHGHHWRGHHGHASPARGYWHGRVYGRRCY